MTDSVVHSSRILEISSGCKVTVTVIEKTHLKMDVTYQITRGCARLQF
jgi:hypothetical protein